MVTVTPSPLGGAPGSALQPCRRSADSSPSHSHSHSHSQISRNSSRKSNNSVTNCKIEGMILWIKKIMFFSFSWFFSLFLSLFVFLLLNEFSSSMQTIIFHKYKNIHFLFISLFLPLFLLINFPLSHLIFLFIHVLILNLYLYKCYAMYM